MGSKNDVARHAAASFQRRVIICIGSENMKDVSVTDLPRTEHDLLGELACRNMPTTVYTLCVLFENFPNFRDQNQQLSGAGEGTGRP